MSPSLQTMGFFMSDINFCNTKEQLNHLGEVVTGKVDGSPAGADIDTSTLTYTGQVRRTLPALESEYDQSIANKEAEADAAIDSYRLLNKGPYASGITLESKFDYITYNGESYFATNPPYTTTATLPDADGNLFLGGYTTFESVANKIGNKNELSNSNFLTSSPDAITHPNATPESYVAGTQIFSGVYAGGSGCTITFIDGRVNCTAGDYQFKLPNTGGLERVPAFTSSVSDYDGIPKTTGVSHALVGEEYVVTVTPSAGDVFSVKLEQGSVSTRHESEIAVACLGSSIRRSLYETNSDAVNSRFFDTIQEAINFCKTMGQACLEIPYGTYNERIQIYGNFGPNGLVIKGNNAVINWDGTGPAIDIDQSITGPAENWRQNIRIHNLNATADKSVTGSSAARVASVTDAVQVTASIDWYGGILRGGSSGLVLDRCITSSFHGLTIRDSGLALSSPDISNLLSFHDCRIVNNDRAGSFNNFGLSTIMFNSCEFEANGFAGNATDGVKSLEFTNAGHVVFNGGHMENSNSQYNLWFDGNPTNGASIEAIGVTWISGAGDVCHVNRGTLNAIGGQISRGAAVNNIYLADSDFAFANLLGGCETTVTGQTQNASMYGKKGVKVGNVSNTAASFALQVDGQSNIVSGKNAFQIMNHESATDGNVFRTEVRDSTAGNLTTIGTQVVGSIFRIQGAGSNIHEFTDDGTKRSRPVGDNDTTGGDASHRYSVLYAATGTINTSDERNKTEIGEISSEVLDAWEEVPIRRYKFVDAVEDKGISARWHVGRIAQDVIAAFERHGLDATEWGVLCFDEWQEQVINYPAIKEDILEGGEKVGEHVIAEAWTETVEAGERYGIRYDEAAQLDAALERRERLKLKDKINTLMNS